MVGAGKKGHTGDGGDLLKATFDGPRGMTMLSSGMLYLAEGENNVVRAVDTNMDLDRLNTDGSFDTTFGSGGIVVVTPPPNGFYSVRGLTIESDRKIVAAGLYGNNSGRPWR